MALVKVIELIDGVRIGAEFPDGMTDPIGLGTQDGYVVVMCDDEEWARYRLTDMIMPPCCLTCIEDGHDVEIDGRCPHNKPSYTLKVGLV